MKKLLTILAITGIFAFSSCGPNAEEQKKADEKAQNDSIEAAAKAQQAAEEAMKQEAAMKDSMPSDTSKMKK